MRLKGTVSFHVAGVVLLSMFSAVDIMDVGAVNGSFGGGDGTPGNPYIIEDVWDLQNMSGNLGAHYVLKNDIDASATLNWNGGAGFAPVGNNTARFTGSLDGKNFTISGLFIKRPGANDVGLLGCAGRGGSAVNIRVTDGNLTGRDGVGGLVGSNQGGAVNNSYANCRVSGYQYVGVLVGSNGGAVSNSHANGDANGTFGIGGLIGSNAQTVRDSHADGNVTGSGALGGLVGSNSGTVWMSYSTANVTGSGNYVGGLAGSAWGGTVDSSYASGNVRGRDGVGGLVGYSDGGSVNNSTATGNVTGTGEGAGGLVGLNKGPVNHSHATGSVNGSSRFVGGLVGNNEGVVNNSYSAGNQTGVAVIVGGLVGYNYYGTVRNSHYPADRVQIKGRPGFMLGALYDSQFQDWLSSGRSLDISDYSTVLVPAGGYYAVSSVQGMKDLLGFADVPGYRFRLEADIDLSQAPGWCIPWLAAEFDGNNHTISNLRVMISYATDVGMVGHNKGGTVRNTAVAGINIAGYSNVGGLVGCNDGGVVENSRAEGNVTGYAETGGLVGAAWKGTVSRSHAEGNVTARGDHLGGLIGYNWGTVRYSHAKTNVSAGSGHYIGGLVGMNDHTIEYSYALGEVTGYGYTVGGLVGYNYYTINNSYARVNVTGDKFVVGGLVGDNHGRVDNSYSTGKVAGIGYSIGGLAGENPGRVENSFWDIYASGQATSPGGTAKVTADMMRRGTFTSAGWNFTDVWCIVENATYPFFIYQDTEPPRAEAGPDVRVDDGAVVKFDGSRSSDDHGIVNYSWSFVDGTPVTLGGPRPTYTFSGPGIYNVTLNVTDAVGRWGADTVRIDVVDITRPAAEAGPDRTIDQHTTVTFDGGSSSDNIGVVNYTWALLDDAPITLHGARPTYRFDNAGTFVVMLTVRDSAGNRATDTTTVTVRDTTAPVAEAGPDRTVDQGSLMVFDAAGSSDNVGIENYTWTFTDVVPVTLYDSQPAYKFDNPGMFVVTLTVKDAAGRWASDALTVTVNDTRAPVANAGPDQEVDEGALVTLDGSGSSDNVGIVKYTWTFADGVLVTLQDRIQQYRFRHPGVFVVTLNVSDAAGNRGSDSMQVVVKDSTPPLADAGEDQRVPVGTVVEFNGSLSSDNVGIAAFSWRFTYEGKTKRLEERTAAFRFDKGGMYEVVLTVADLAGNSDDDRVNITVVDTGIVTGKVLDGKRNPVEGATVRITASNGMTCTTATAADGTFSVEVHHGPFTWMVSKDGYQNITGSSTVGPMEEVQLNLSDHPLKRRDDRRQSEGPSIPVLPVVLAMAAASAVGGYLIMRRRAR